MFWFCATIDVERVIVDTLRELDWKHEYFAALLGLSAPTLAQQLQKRGHISLRRLVAIAVTEDGRIFWRAFLPKLAEAVGVEDRDAQVVQVRRFLEVFPTLIDKLQISMVKANLEVRDDAQRRA